MGKQRDFLGLLIFSGFVNFFVLGFVNIFWVSGFVNFFFFVCFLRK